MTEQTQWAMDVGGLIGAVERLRAVRHAHERFLALWALERLLESPAAADRAWSDLVGVDLVRADQAGADNDGPIDGGAAAYSRTRWLDD